MDYATSIGRCIQTRLPESLTVLGGEYTITSTCAGNSAAIFTACDSYIEDVTIKVHSDDSSIIRGIWAPNNNNIEIIDSDIDVSGESPKAYGVTLIPSAAIISNCKIYVASPYLFNDDRTDYTSCNFGISSSTGVLTVENCDVTGSLAAISSTDGTLIVRGGTYKGYAHGGFYLMGNESTPAYIYDATLVSLDENPGGYESATDASNDAGIYIGGSSSIDTSGSTNFILYMDGCTVLNAKQALVIRGTSGELGHKVYVSNTEINDGSYVRIDSDIHKLFIGENCNFDDSDCRSITHETLTPEEILARVELTNENYRVTS